MTPQVTERKVEERLPHVTVCERSDRYEQNQDRANPELLRPSGAWIKECRGSHCQKQLESLGERE